MDLTTIPSGLLAFRPRGAGSDAGSMVAGHRGRSVTMIDTLLFLFTLFVIPLMLYFFASLLISLLLFKSRGLAVSISVTAPLLFMIVTWNALWTISGMHSDGWSHMCAIFLLVGFAPAILFLAPRTRLFQSPLVSFSLIGLTSALLTSLLLNHSIPFLPK